MLFVIIAIAFYSVSIWQYRNPTKVILLWGKQTYTTPPSINEALVRRSIILRGVLFTLVVTGLILNYLHEY